MGIAYTKRGDSGYTYDFSGRKIRKDNYNVIIQGKIDNLQSSIDSAVLVSKGRTKKMLLDLQDKLWQTAGELSCMEECVKNPVSEKDLEQLEIFIDSLGETPNRFVRFRTKNSIIYNECRIKCRELEILLVQFLSKKKIRPVVYKYINRLSSLFFMLAYKNN